MKQEYKVIPTQPEEIRHIARKMRKDNVILAMIHGYLDENGEAVISYEFQVEPGIESYCIRGHARVPSISDIYDKAAEWPERELNELFGFEFEGLDTSKRLFLPDNMLSGQGQIIVTPMDELIRDRYSEKAGDPDGNASGSVIEKVSDTERSGG
ncbi:MAG: NADH-quinone oxidoreductase subunit C [Lachnospiraceae bacterium]|nr:NADH-quinone oxidoreductase subunit C [Lachnospiraceae bacterium]